MRYSSSHFKPYEAIIANTTLIIAFVIYIIRNDFPLRDLPVVGKYFKKPFRI